VAEFVCGTREKNLEGLLGPLQIALLALAVRRKVMR
jgi:hypothetical protein